MRERLYHEQHSEGRIEHGEYDRCEQRVDPSELGVVDTGPLNVGHWSEFKAQAGFYAKRSAAVIEV